MQRVLSDFLRRANIEFNFRFCSTGSKYNLRTVFQEQREGVSCIVEGIVIWKMMGGFFLEVAELDNGDMGNGSGALISKELHNLLDLE